MRENNLKAIRADKGKTQEQIAKQAKVSVRCYQKYEAGICVPNVYTAQLIAKALGTDVSKLFGETEDASN